MYRYSTHYVKDAGELTAPPGYSLVETQYAAPDRLICIWIADGSVMEVGWGETTLKADPFLEPGFDELRAKNDPVSISGTA